MSTDTHGLSKELEGKHLRMFFADGEVCEMKLLHCEVHENCDFCDGYAWFIYDMLSTNHPERYKSPGVYSGHFEDIDHFEVAADQASARSRRV